MAAVNQSSEDHVYPCSGRRYVTMRMLHALFMLVAMAVAMPTALFLSRYPKSKQCSTVYVGLRVRHISYYSTSIPLIHAHEHIRFVAKKSKFMHKYIYIIINTININNNQYYKYQYYQYKYAEIFIYLFATNMHLRSFIVCISCV